MLFLYVGSEAKISGYPLRHVTNVCDPEDDMFRPESQSREGPSMPWTPLLPYSFLFLCLPAFPQLSVFPRCKDSDIMTRENILTNSFDHRSMAAFSQTFPSQLKTELAR